MDRATMQNLLLFGGAGGVPGVPSGLTNNNNESSNSGLNDQQAAAFAGYPALMRSYLQQQQQQAAAQAAASLSDPRMAALGGGTGMSGLGGAGAAGGLGFGSGGPGGFLPQGAGVGRGNAPGPDYMDANRMLLQRLQGGQQGAGWVGDMSGDGDPYAENGILGPWSATSAGLLGKMAVNNQDKGKKVRRKPKDKPKRPLSAYNIFFKEERGRILEKIPDSEAKSGAGGDAKTRKRKKRPHGKIGFENLAKVIGQRWQELTPDQVEYYKKKAEEDMKRYKDQMEDYLAKQDDGKKKKDAPVADEVDSKDDTGFDVGPVSKKIKHED